MSLKLWFARVLRVGGIGLFFASLAQVWLLTWWGFVAPPPSIVTNLYVFFILTGLSIVLMIIGDKISPPDPWLDSWLSPFRGHKPQLTKAESETREVGQAWATIMVDRPGSSGWRISQGERCFLQFEDGFMFLGRPGKELDLLEPKRIIRARDNVLSIDTGQWSYGEVTLTFESNSDADNVKQGILKLLSRTLNMGHKPIPQPLPK